MQKFYAFPRRATNPPPKAPHSTVEFSVIAHDGLGHVIHGSGNTYSLIGITLGLNGLHEREAYASGFMYSNCFGLDGVE